LVHTTPTPITEDATVFIFDDEQENRAHRRCPLMCNAGLITEVRAIYIYTRRALCRYRWDYSAMIAHQCFPVPPFDYAPVSHHARRCPSSYNVRAHEQVCVYMCVCTKVSVRQKFLLSDPSITFIITIRIGEHILYFRTRDIYGNLGVTLCREMAIRIVV